MRTIVEFLDELFTLETDGYVYAPTMTFKWNPFFFRWPEQRDEIISHLNDSAKRDVYISPALFSKPRVSPVTFKGTWWVWSEFDGEVPATPEHPPTLRVQSSKPGHEHWYWKLDHFESDPEKIQDVTKRLAYHLKADLSVWDYAQVLRPPNTFNHKRNCKAFVLERNDGTYSLNEFQNLPKPPTLLEVDIDTKTLPTLQKLIATYKWTDDAYELLAKKVQPGHRSDALTRLAFECAEMGMSNQEIFVVLQDADTRWEKFTRRTDRKRQLTRIISHVRSKKAITSELEEKPTIYRFQDFMNTDVKLDWVIPGLIPVAGSGVIFGPANVGKSTLTLRMGMAIATGKKNFLNWKIERQQRVGFVSLEMPHDELKHFFNDMQLDEDTRERLQENFIVWPVGHAYPFDVRDQQSEILKYVDMFQLELLIIDSLGVAMYGSVSSDDDVKRLNSFLNQDLRKDRGCGYFFVHHPRKPGQQDIKKPQDFYDMFGSVYISNNAQTIMNLNPLSRDLLKLNLFKTRLSMDQDSFQVKRLSNRDFIIPEKPYNIPKQRDEGDL